WFFLAMAEWQRGNKDDARRWYDWADQWMEKNARNHEEFQRFRAEARDLLKVGPETASNDGQSADRHTELREVPRNLSRAFKLEQHGTAQGALVTERNTQRVTVTAVDGTDWHIQLQHFFDDLVEGASYAVRFRARADQPLDVALVGYLDEPGWTNI